MVDDAGAFGAVDPDLVSGVDLLCLDAGNTVIFLDHARVARIGAGLGVHLEVDALIRAEGEAKRLQEQGKLLQVEWSHRAAPGAAGWSATTATFLVLAGAPEARIAELLDAYWREHVRFNLWSLVPDDLAPALARVRAAGVKVAVISNSEGMLAELFEALGILRCFDRVVDSGIAGVEKPDPRIFRIALDELGATKERALHLGDIYATDVLGARAAGIRVALVDPRDHFRGMHPDVPRVDGVARVADAIVQHRSR